MTFARHLMSLLVLVGLAPVTACAQLSGPATDLTIEVEGDMLRHGGVVRVYHIPVLQAEWPSILTPSPVATVRLSARYAEVQVRYLAEGVPRYRFQTAGAGTTPEPLATQLLSIIGSNTDNSSPALSQGFVGGNPSGGRIIRIPAQAEYAGANEATRTMARWGETQGYEALPPADETSARALVIVINGRPRKPDMTCSGDALVQTCVVAAHAWERVTLLWWRALAESRLERLSDRALRRCYDENLAKGGGDHCKSDPTSKEPAFVWRP